MTRSKKRTMRKTNSKRQAAIKNAVVDAFSALTMTRAYLVGNPGSKIVLSHDPENGFGCYVTDGAYEDLGFGESLDQVISVTVSDAIDAMPTEEVGNE